MPVCELCGGTSFVKQEGMFVCEGCGTKYTPEDARNLHASNNAEPENAPHANNLNPTDTSIPNGHTAGEVAMNAPQAAANGSQVAAANEFNLQVAAISATDLRNVNNAICLEWQMLVERYKKFEHPTKPQLDTLVAHAKENLFILDKAAMADSEKYVQNTLIYNNCIAIEEAVLDLECYEQKEGEWKRIAFPVKRQDIRIAGQKESWQDKRDVHRKHIEQEYLGMHENEVAIRGELEAQAAKLQSELDELKAEKKSKGFFNFAEKGEVKERMAPVKDQLADVNAQIRAIDRRVSDYVDDRIAELGKSYTILSF